MTNNTDIHTKDQRLFVFWKSATESSLWTSCYHRNQAFPSTETCEPGFSIQQHRGYRGALITWLLFQLAFLNPLAPPSLPVAPSWSLWTFFLLAESFRKLAEGQLDWHDLLKRDLFLAGLINFPDRISYQKNGAESYLYYDLWVFGAFRLALLIGWNRT